MTSKCLPNKIVSFKFGSDATAVILENLDMKKSFSPKVLKSLESLFSEFFVQPFWAFNV